MILRKSRSRIKENPSKIPEDDFSGDKSTNSVINLFNASTNPDEASSAAIKLLNYISTDNVNFILTTHYTKICKKVNKKYSKNYYMNIEKDSSKKMTQRKSRESLNLIKPSAIGSNVHDTSIMSAI